MDIVNETIEKDKTIKDLKTDYPDKIKNLEEALLNYMGDDDLMIFRTEFLDKWNYLSKN